MYSVGWQLFHFSTESNISTCTQHMAGNTVQRHLWLQISPKMLVISFDQ